MLEIGQIDAVLREERTGATVTRRSGDNWQLQHPLASSLSILCDPTIPWRRNASLYAPTAYPSAAFFDAIATAGSTMTGLDRGRARAAILRCQAAAFRDQDGDGQIDVPGFQATCSETKSPAPGFPDFGVWGRPP